MNTSLPDDNDVPEVDLIEEYEAACHSLSIAQQRKNPLLVSKYEGLVKMYRDLLEMEYGAIEDLPTEWDLGE